MELALQQASFERRMADMQVCQLHLIWPHVAGPASTILLVTYGYRNSTEQFMLLL